MGDPSAVADAYDRIASKWRADRLAPGSGFPERRYLERLTQPLRARANVLDVGCGCGEPITAYLAGCGFDVVGLDASARLLDFARQAVPQARFLLGDMRTAEPGGPFAAIVAWDCVFHLPRLDHAHVFERFGTWLQPEGRLLLSLGGSAEASFTSEMHGETFYYSGYEPAQALRLLQGAGFDVEHWEVDDPSSRGHIAVLAVRRAA